LRKRPGVARCGHRRYDECAATEEVSHGATMRPQPMRSRDGSRMLFQGEVMDS
jgi:hypothetical protein